LTAVLSSQFLGLAFGIFLALLAVRMIASNKIFQRHKTTEQKPKVSCEAECFKNRKRLALGFVLSFFAGVISGLLGIGGGVVLVPILLLVMFLPMYAAVATSMFLVALTSLFGVFQHYTLGNIDFTYALPLAVGAFVGAQVGAWISKRISAEKVQLVFAAALVIVGLQMILNYL
jgi:uncharacterized membrane protein YfcA